MRHTSGALVVLSPCYSLQCAAFILLWVVFSPIFCIHLQSYMESRIEFSQAFMSLSWPFVFVYLSFDVVADGGSQLLNIHPSDSGLMSKVVEVIVHFVHASDQMI